MGEEVEGELGDASGLLGALRRAKETRSGFDIYGGSFEVPRSITGDIK